MNADWPFAIAVAPNGARRTKRDHPRLPISVDEIVRDAAEALDAGAAMIHLHVRDRDGRHVLDADLYRDAMKAVRRETGDRLVVQITTEAVGLYSPAEQIAIVDAVMPESVSVALREIVPDVASEKAAAGLFERAWRAGMLVQIIVYDPTELMRIADLAARGVIPTAHPPVLAVLGRYSGTGASEAELEAFHAGGISAYPWMLCAFGPGEAGYMGAGAGAGSHARVGFENNLHLPDGSTAPNNAALVAAAAEAAFGTGRRLASAQELRRLWFTLPPRQWQRKPGHAHDAPGSSQTPDRANVQQKETQT